MNNKRINLVETFGLATISKVTYCIRPILQNDSYAIAAIYLGELYRKLNCKERKCMLNILDVIHNGSFRKIIDLMNIKSEDKLNYMKAETLHFGFFIFNNIIH